MHLVFTALLLAAPASAADHSAALTWARAPQHRPAQTVRGGSLVSRPGQMQRAPANGRGLWMHYHDGDPYGTSTILGNPGAEALALTRLAAWSVARVYGGFRDLPVTHPERVAAWNGALHDDGVESQLLLGQPHQIFVGADCRGELIEHIQERLLDFHAGPGALPPMADDERFDALHLDLEPHAFKASYYDPGSPPACAPTAMYWTPANRALLFGLLYDTLVDVRDFLDANGHADLPIHIDLPYWVDTSSSFDWSTTPDFVNGIDWIYAASEVVDGMTFMTYENDDPADIRTDIIGERMVLLSSIDVRPSVNAKERADWSSILTWTSLGQFWDVVEDLESGTGLYSYNVDLHNYRYLANPWPLVLAPGFPASPVR